MSRLSVIIPVRNGEAFLADAVESALAQSGVDVEVVVVDDGSRDATPEVIAGFGGRIGALRQEGRGVSAARNAGIAHSGGELLVFLDADDVLPAGFLVRFVEAAASAPGVEVFHCGWQGVELDGTVLYEQALPIGDYDRDPFHTLAALGCPPISAGAFRRAAVARIGGFDESQDFQSDFDFWLRLAASGAVFQGVPGNVAVYRRHGESRTARSATRTSTAALAVLERNLARHERCAACVQADRGVRSWRRAVLRSSAVDFARRLHLEGRAARGIGLGLALVRRPRLAPAAWQELRDGRRARAARV